MNKNDLIFLIICIIFVFVTLIYYFIQRHHKKKKKKEKKELSFQEIIKIKPKDSGCWLISDQICPSFNILKNEWSKQENVISKLDCENHKYSKYSACDISNIESHFNPIPEIPSESGCYMYGEKKCGGFITKPYTWKKIDKKNYKDCVDYTNPLQKCEGFKFIFNE